MIRFLRSVFSFNSTSITGIVTLLVAGLFIAGVPILDLLELKTYDLRFLSRGKQAPSPHIVLAVLDEKSLDVEGRWPWPRSKIAALVDALSVGGAKVIGIDIAFIEPDENTQLELIGEFERSLRENDIRNRNLEEFLVASRIKADHDLVLADSIRNASARVVLGYFFYMDRDSINFDLEPEQIEKRLGRIAASKYPLVRFSDQRVLGSPFIEAYAPETNLDIFSRATDSNGYFNMMPDRDGVVRWMPLIIRCGEDLFPPLPVQCLWNYLDRPMLTIQVALHGVEGLQMGERFIPTDESGMILINYLGPPMTFLHYSITDILKGNFPPEAFKDKIVLVGPTATGIYDVRNTPFSPVFPGVEIHATLVDNMLTQSFLNKPGWTALYDLLAILLMGAVIGAALPRVSALAGLISAVFLFAAHIVVSGYLFNRWGIWLNVAYPLIALVLTYVSLTSYSFFTEEREKRKIRGTFRYYLPDTVIEEMLRHPEKLRLGGEEKVATVLFSDLMGFSGYSERYTPHEMVTFLNEYFEEMTAKIFLCGGMLGAYIGDELMALFGAPLPQEDHARQACMAALEMRSRLVELQTVWADAGRPALDARIGVNSGRMLVGNMGSSFRYSYTVLGDDVNLASRLEGLSGIYGTRILIGENTYSLLGDAFLVRHVDLVAVKGRDRPLRIYELLGRAGAQLPSGQATCLTWYEKGLEDYLKRRWRDAIPLFEEALAHWPADGPSRLMIERCMTYRNDPPGEGWDGVFRFERKR